MTTRRRRPARHGRSRPERSLRESSKRERRRSARESLTRSGSLLPRVRAVRRVRVVVDDALVGRAGVRRRRRCSRRSARARTAARPSERSASGDSIGALQALDRLGGLALRGQQPRRVDLGCGGDLGLAVAGGALERLGGRSPCLPLRLAAARITEAARPASCRRRRRRSKVLRGRLVPGGGRREGQRRRRGARLGRERRVQGGEPGGQLLARRGPRGTIFTRKKPADEQCGADGDGDPFADAPAVRW